MPAPTVRYVGRFAPSPTGDLHLGSLLAAVGSYLEARRAGGEWLLRIEDLDTPRNVPGAADRIITTLARLGFVHQRDVIWQSQLQARHRAALAALDACGALFACACSRRQRAQQADEPGGCVADCADRQLPHAGHALRFRMPAEAALLRWHDRLQGPQQLDARQYRDVVVRRRDGIVAYQLAVVVDDAAAGVTDVVRGADLIDSTPWQRGLQHALALAEPGYAHLPVLLEPDGAKLAKSRHSLPIDLRQPSATLGQALALLRHPPPPGHGDWPVARLWDWAVEHWQPARITGLREIRLG